MTLRFKGSDLRPVLSEAIAKRCRVILAKDHGVYFLSERGDRRPDGRWERLAYAVGCHPDVDAFDDWWALMNAECGGDDFGEYLDPHDEILALILRGGYDLSVSFTATRFFLGAVKAAEDD